jgi:hypothetical protein
MRRIRQHLTYANVMATIAVFIAISGGTAVALNGANTVQSDDLGPGAQVKAPDIADSAVNSADVANESLTNADVKNFSLGNGDFLTGSVDSRVATDASLTGTDVKNEALTGADVANQSGVDTCTHGTVRYGELCVGVANANHPWLHAQILCANLNLRLPTLGEARALAGNYDLPNVATNEPFWTEETHAVGNENDWAYVIHDQQNTDMGSTLSQLSAFRETVCVTTPTN